MNRCCPTIRTFENDFFTKRRPIAKSFYFRFSKKLAMVFLAFIIVCFIFTYLIQINNLATKGFELREVEDQIALIKDENKKLELELVKYQSMGYLNSRAKDLGMVEVNEIKYLDTTGTSFAFR